MGCWWSQVGITLKGDPSRHPQGRGGTVSFRLKPRGSGISGWHARPDAEQEEAPTDWVRPSCGLASLSSLGMLGSQHTEPDGAAAR